MNKGAQKKTGITLLVIGLALLAITLGMFSSTGDFKDSSRITLGLGIILVFIASGFLISANDNSSLNPPSSIGTP